MADNRNRLINRLTKSIANGGLEVSEVFVSEEGFSDINEEDFLKLGEEPQVHLETVIRFMEAYRKFTAKTYPYVMSMALNENAEDLDVQNKKDIYLSDFNIATYRIYQLKKSLPLDVLSNPLATHTRTLAALAGTYEMLNSMLDDPRNIKLAKLRQLNEFNIQIHDAELQNQMWWRNALFWTGLVTGGLVVASAIPVAWPALFVAGLAAQNALQLYAFLGVCVFLAAAYVEVKLMGHQIEVADKPIDNAEHVEKKIHHRAGRFFALCKRTYLPHQLQDAVEATNNEPRP